jgi:anaerobic dimethyl sulfoxide reductase subunit A
LPRAAFRADPEANPLNTASGKLEIHCQALADVIASYGWTTIAPIVKYKPPLEGVEDTFEDWERGMKGKYPLQLFTIHYARRSHSTLDNVTWLREAFPQEFMMNTLDAMLNVASRRGISSKSAASMGLYFVRCSSQTG